jgi:hypothetical protein
MPRHILFGKHGEIVNFLFNIFPENIKVLYDLQAIYYYLPVIMKL